jgi:hypothetical protein
MMKASPKHHQLRTAAVEKRCYESEAPPTSDSRCRKTEPRVRSTSNFGQRSRKNGAGSPKQHQLQTATVEKQCWESEAPPTSDSDHRKTVSRVRSYTNFRQSSQKKRAESLEQHQLRTVAAEKRNRESEAPPTSDSRRRKTEPRVRSTTNFGQPPQKNGAKSPKHPHKTPL